MAFVKGAPRNGEKNPLRLVLFILSIVLCLTCFYMMLDFQTSTEAKLSGELILGQVDTVSYQQQQDAPVLSFFFEYFGVASYLWALLIVYLGYLLLLKPVDIWHADFFKACLRILGFNLLLIGSTGLLSRISTLGSTGAGGLLGDMLNMFCDFILPGFISSFLFALVAFTGVSFLVGKNPFIFFDRVGEAFFKVVPTKSDNKKSKKSKAAKDANADAASDDPEITVAPADGVKQLSLGDGSKFDMESNAAPNGVNPAAIAGAAGVAALGAAAMANTAGASELDLTDFAQDPNAAGSNIDPNAMAQAQMAPQALNDNSAVSEPNGMNDGVFNNAETEEALGVNEANGDESNLALLNEGLGENLPLHPSMQKVLDGNNADNSGLSDGIHSKLDDAVLNPVGAESTQDVKNDVQDAIAADLDDEGLDTYIERVPPQGGNVSFDELLENEMNAEGIVPPSAQNVEAESQELALAQDDMVEAPLADQALGNEGALDNEAFAAQDGEANFAPEYPQDQYQDTQYEDGAYNDANANYQGEGTYEPQYDENEAQNYAHDGAYDENAPYDSHDNYQVGDNYDTDNYQEGAYQEGNYQDGQAYAPQDYAENAPYQGQDQYAPEEGYSNESYDNAPYEAQDANNYEALEGEINSGVAVAEADDADEGIPVNLGRIGKGYVPADFADQGYEVPEGGFSQYQDDAYAPNNEEAQPYADDNVEPYVPQQEAQGSYNEANNYDNQESLDQDFSADDLVAAVADDAKHHVSELSEESFAESPAAIAAAPASAAAPAAAAAAPASAVKAAPAAPASKAAPANAESGLGDGVAKAVGAAAKGAIKGAAKAALKGAAPAAKMAAVAAVEQSIAPNVAAAAGAMGAAAIAAEALDAKDSLTGTESKMSKEPVESQDAPAPTPAKAQKSIYSTYASEHNLVPELDSDTSPYQDNAETQEESEPEKEEVHTVIHRTDPSVFAAQQAAAKAKREAEEKAKREAEEKAKREAEEKAKREAEEKAQREAEEKAKREAEEKAQREAEEKAQREAEEKAKREAEEKAQREAEEKAQADAAQDGATLEQDKAQDDESLDEDKSSSSDDAKKSTSQDLSSAEEDGADDLASDDDVEEDDDEDDDAPIYAGTYYSSYVAGKEKDVADDEGPKYITPGVSEEQMQAKAGKKKKKKKVEEPQAVESADESEDEQKGPSTIIQDTRKEFEENARIERERKAKEEAERKAREEAERKAKEEQEALAKEAEAKAKAEAEANKAKADSTLLEAFTELAAEMSDISSHSAPSASSLANNDSFTKDPVDALEKNAAKENEGVTPELVNDFVKYAARSAEANAQNSMNALNTLSEPINEADAKATEAANNSAASGAQSIAAKSVEVNMFGASGEDYSPKHAYDFGGDQKAGKIDESLMGTAGGRDEEFFTGNSHENGVFVQDGGLVPSSLDDEDSGEDNIIAFPHIEPKKQTYEMKGLSSAFIPMDNETANIDDLEGKPHASLTLHQHKDEGETKDDAVKADKEPEQSQDAKATSAKEDAAKAAPVAANAASANAASAEAPAMVGPDGMLTPEAAQMMSQMMMGQNTQMFTFPNGQQVPCVQMPNGQFVPLINGMPMYPNMMQGMPNMAQGMTMPQGAMPQGAMPQGAMPQFMQLPNGQYVPVMPNAMAMANAQGAVPNASNAAPSATAPAQAVDATKSDPKAD